MSTATARLTGLLMLPLGVAAAYVDLRLVHAARAYCDAAAEPGHLPAMIIYDFAQAGTLAGHPGDSGLCGSDDVPPWWPAWPPS